MLLLGGEAHGVKICLSGCLTPSGAIDRGSDSCVCQPLPTIGATVLVLPLLGLWMGDPFSSLFSELASESCLVEGRVGLVNALDGSGLGDTTDLVETRLFGSTRLFSPSPRSRSRLRMSIPLCDQLDGARP